MGGRVVATPHGPAALFMYDHDHGTRLVILSRPMAIKIDEPMQPLSQRGISGFAWVSDGMGYSLVGPSTVGDLHPLANEARRQVCKPLEIEAVRSGATRPAPSSRHVEHPTPSTVPAWSPPCQNRLASEPDLAAMHALLDGSEIAAEARIDQARFIDQGCSSVIVYELAQTPGRATQPPAPVARACGSRRSHTRPSASERSSLTYSAWDQASGVADPVPCPIGSTPPLAPTPS
jgi:hypothetical protein